MSTSTLTGQGQRAKISARTLRTDRWWLPPLVTFVGLERLGRSTRTVRVFMQKWYWVDDYHYLTPFYSPCVSEGCVPEAAHFGTVPAGLVVHPVRGRSRCRSCCCFRLTCYYYRKAYYRAFWLSPPACAVAEPHKTYTGETRFPLIFQNAAPLLLLRRPW